MELKAEGIICIPEGKKCSWRANVLMFSCWPADTSEN